MLFHFTNEETESDKGWILAQSSMIIAVTGYAQGHTVLHGTGMR